MIATILISIIVNFILLLFTISALKKGYLQEFNQIVRKYTELEEKLEILNDEVKVYLIASKPMTTSGITVQEFLMPKDKYELL